jgi:type I restriction enzyme R subunit
MPEQPLFRPFDEAGDVRIYERNLPHLRQPGATYFVTFRQGDSVPAEVLEQWQDDRQRWWKAHGIDPRWQRADPDRFHAAYAKISESVRRAFERDQARKLHEELDHGHGSCILRHAPPQQVLCDAMKFFHGVRLWMGDFVIMPNHVHALILPADGWELEDLLGSIKKWSSRRIGQWLDGQPAETRPVGPHHNKPRFWQQEAYDRIVRDIEELTAYRRYIARNPEVAQLRPGEYTYHAAPWLDAFAQRPSSPRPPS